MQVSLVAQALLLYHFFQHQHLCTQMLALARQQHLMVKISPS